MTKKISRVAFLVAISCFFALPANALVYHFNTADTVGIWSGDTTMPGYGSIKITEDTGGINFEIVANPEYFVTDQTDQDESSGLTWDKFFFNFNPDLVLDTSLIDFSNDGTWSVITDQNSSTFGIFDYGAHGSSLPLMVNPLQFAIHDTSLDVLDFIYPNMDGNYFAGHLRRFGDDNEQSIQLAVAPVPEPGTLILIGSGLGGLLLYRKRRAN